MSHAALPPTTTPSAASQTGGRMPTSSYQQSLPSENGSNSNQTGKNVLFVGNLSYFCEERDLVELFDHCAHVHGVRIMRNASRTRSLMFGFVILASDHEASEIERIFNGSFFMGRNLKVSVKQGRSDMRYSSDSADPSTTEGVAIHVSFLSHFQPDDQLMVRPTESWLRKTFSTYGMLLDCSVKDYQHKIKDGIHTQEGYGFLIFASNEDALNVTHAIQRVTIQGITLTCNISYPNTKSAHVPRVSSTEDVHGPPSSAPPSSNTSGPTPPNPQYAQPTTIPSPPTITVPYNHGAIPMPPPKMIPMQYPPMMPPYAVAPAHPSGHGVYYPPFYTSPAMMPQQPYAVPQPYYPLQSQTQPMPNNLGQHSSEQPQYGPQQQHDYQPYRSQH